MLTLKEAAVFILLLGAIYLTSYLDHLAGL